MKKRSVISLLLAAMMALGMLLTGCGAQFDASAYVQALLDNSYKNDPSGIVEQEMGTEEEANALYEEGLDTEMESLTSGITISDELKAEYRAVFADMFAKAKYTVGESEKLEDGSYEVTVKYETMKIFEPAMTTYEESLAQLQEEWSVNVPSDEEMYEQIYGLLKDCISEELPNAEYGAEESMIVRVEIVDNMYSPNQEDLLNLELALFDMDAMNNL